MATVRKRGERYQVQIRRTGQRAISRSFGQFEDAKRWARQMEIEADRRQLPSDPRALDQLTLGELVERYRDTVSVRKRTAHIETTVLNSFLRHPVCARTLSELRTEHFALYRDHRLRLIKPATLRRELDVVRHMFRVARDEWGLPISENPLAKLKLPSANNRRERRLRPGEFDRLVDAASECKNPHVLPVIKLAIETAMRRGELLAIRSDHIDLDRRTLLIPESKNGHARTIPLSPKAFELNRSRVIHAGEPGERLFPVTANAFRLSWERLKRRAGIEDLHFHDLRHEAISRFFEMGLTAPEVALISGHRDMRMLFRYTHAMVEGIHRKMSG